jgi:formate C-acetyltransferase
MDKGQDLVMPDPEYCKYGLSDRAIVDTGDSLMAIKHLVFDKKMLTMDELMNALDSNFEGMRGEEIRQMCLAVPKFGNDIDEVDRLVGDVGAFSGAAITAFDNSPYKRYQVSREGLAWHYYGGLGVGALPNGRKALEPLDDGSISPMRGMDKNGPTAVLRSVLKAGFPESYGSVLNQRFNISILKTEEDREKFAMYTDTFFRSGGQHIQYNITDAQELADAKVHPDNHHDLIVRIGGFSAYFTQLSSQIQDDVIDRSEHTI